MDPKPTSSTRRPDLRPGQLPLWWLLKGISQLPMPVLYAFSTFLYGVIYHVIGYRKKVVRQNLSRSFPAMSSKQRLGIEKQFYRNLTDIIVESMTMVSLSPEALEKRVAVRGKELVEKHLTNGTPVLIMGAHLGNWEFMSAAGNKIFSYPVDGVYKPLASSFFEAFMRFLRTRFGITLVRMKDTLRHLLRYRGQVRILSLLSDQIPPFGEIQYWTTFLHQDTAFYVGAEKLRTTFGYATFFVGMRHLKRGYYEIEFQELLPTPMAGEKSEGHLLTEAFARRLETWVEHHPAEYLWSHKRWKHKRPEAARSEY